MIVCAGAWLSGFLIVATNAWMQHPVGYRIAADGTVLLENIWAVLFSQFAYWQFAHDALCGALLTGGFIVAGVGAYYSASRRDEAIGRRLVRAGTIVAFMFALIVVFPTGDRNGRDVTQYQPVKLAAEEGLFHDRARGPARDHWNARRRAQALNRSDLRPGYLELSSAMETTKPTSLGSMRTRASCGRPSS